MTLEIIQELDSTLSMYLLDNFSISISEPVTMVLWLTSYSFMILMALVTINQLTQDTYSSSSNDDEVSK
ncbi:hypothetical protein [Pseudoalteromonas arctica]|uniref:Uncharacterized protein n=2 Tax=Pseudoalteromonas TaxID=53246 RepID=A0A7Y0DPJ4_9GAMM|nr:hypothetical protein [Pseudoalteromonas arctica]NMM39285.1 hypothetical protein [Pseudoalteromonas arctica]